MTVGNLGTRLIQLKRLELHSAAPRATLTPLSCSPNFPRAQYLDIHTLTHELIVKLSTAKERRLNQFGTAAKTLSSTGSVAFFDIGAAGDLFGVPLMCRAKCIHYNNL